MWTPGGDPLVLAIGRRALILLECRSYLPLGVLNCIRVLGGYTQAQSAATVFDTENFVESEYLAQIQVTSGNLSLTLNWSVELSFVHKTVQIISSPQV